MTQVAVVVALLLAIMVFLGRAAEPPMVDAAQKRAASAEATVQALRTDVARLYPTARPCHVGGNYQTC